MRATLHTLATLGGLAMGLAAGSGYAQDNEPGLGHTAVVYTGTFNAESFDEAKTIVVEGFGEAMAALDLNQQTFWLADPDTHQIVAISFFEDESSVEAWRDHGSRLEIMDRLDPLRSAPNTMQVFEMIGSRRTGD